MPEIKSYSQGVFCWADNATTDQNAAKNFATVKKAREKKGSVMKEPWDIPNVGRLAFLKDTGAVFAIIKSSPM